MGRQIPWVGMDGEKQRLVLAFRERESLLVLGAAGSGKTRLIREALEGNEEILYIPWAQPLRSLLVAMARRLIAAGHASFLLRAQPGAAVDGWLAAQKSIHLRGLLWAAMETSPVPMALDGIAGAGFPTYRFLQRLYHTPGMALFAASRDPGSLGALGRLFWNPARILHVPPLSARDAWQLFETAADGFGLRNLDLAEFREKVLESAHGNPGQIVEMCRLAADPQYISGRAVKFSALRIDTVIKFGG